MIPLTSLCAMRATRLANWPEERLAVLMMTTLSLSPSKFACCSSARSTTTSTPENINIASSSASASASVDFFEPASDGIS